MYNHVNVKLPKIKFELPFRTASNKFTYIKCRVRPEQQNFQKAFNINFFEKK